MKFLIKKNKLMNLIKLSTSIINNQSYNPMLVNVFIEADEEKKELITIFSNEQITCKYIIKEDIEIVKSGSIVLRSKLLSGVISKLQNEDITFEKIDTQSLKIFNSKFDANINLLNESLFPSFDFSYNENATRFSLPSVLLKDVHKKTTPCSLSINEKLSVLNGIYFDAEREEGIINFITTDSFKAAFLNEEYNGNKMKFILDVDTLKIINEFNNDVNKDINFVLDNSKLIIDLGDICILARTIQGIYPNIYNNFNIEPKIKFEVDCLELINGLEHGLSIVQGDKSPAALIIVNNEILEIKFKSLELGSTYEKIKIKNFIGQEIKFLINARYLINILKSFDNELIKFEITESNKPIIVKDIKNDKFKELILPMRNN